MAQTLSVIFGVGSVYLCWKVTAELWSSKAAYKSAWVVAVFPTWLLYSVLTLREVYIYVFTFFAILWSIRYIDSRRFFHLFMAVVSFLISSLFHGAMSIGLISLVLFVGYERLLKSRDSVVLRYAKFIFILSIAVLVILASSVSIPYIGSLSDLSIENIHSQGVNTLSGSSRYPIFLIINDYIDLFLLLPLRVVYFLFGPMIFSVNEVAHIIGSFDGLIYLLMFSLLWKNREFLLKNSKTKLLLFMLVSYIVVFSLGVGNYGTALRHRAKLFPIIIVLSAPFLPSIVINGSSYVRRNKKLLLNRE
jgi:hypothetical protein